jgi:rhodanese-related sulfurtransferase
MSYQIEWKVPLECISREELLERINSKHADYIVIDTIGSYEGNRFRIKGAMTIHYPEVIDRRNELPPFKEIIIYCTRKSCPASKKVAAGLVLLKVQNVKVYEGGIEEWIAHDLPVEEV